MNLPKITHAMLVVTHSCNLRCRYCFVQQQPQTMSYETAKAAVHFLIENCADKEIPSINFFGGEPMLCWDSIIAPLTEYIREELAIPFHLSMTTNGTLLTKERIDFMKKYHINLLFSIDGDQITQDYNRPCADGSSSFKLLSDLIPLIADTFHPTFRMTAIPQTCQYTFDNIMFAEQFGFPGFFIVPNVFEEWSDKDWTTLTQEMHHYSQYFIDCYNQGKEPIRFSDIEKSLHKITQINRAITKNKYRIACDACRKCGLGMKHFASIHPNGNIYACQEMTSNAGEENLFYIGNIYTGMDNKRRLVLANSFSKDRLQGYDCDNCKLKRICDGGCVANNFLLTGDLNQVPKVYCKWMQFLLDEAIFIMNSLSSNSRFIKEWGEKYGR